jgi:hypothetical protein
MTMQADRRYAFSFITGALFVPETVAVAELLAAGKDWPTIRESVSNENLLKLKTSGSRVRILREIRYRLQEFDSEELDYFSAAGSRDQRLMLLLSISRRFAFVREFIEEVVRPKALSLETHLIPGDFVRFFDLKGADAPEVDELTPKSHDKVRQVMVRMLAEGGLLNSTSEMGIQRPSPGTRLIHLIAKKNPADLKTFLLSDADIRDARS